MDEMERLNRELARERQLYGTLDEDGRDLFEQAFYAGAYAAIEINQGPPDWSRAVEQELNKARQKRSGQ